MAETASDTDLRPAGDSPSPAPAPPAGNGAEQPPVQPQPSADAPDWRAELAGTDEKRLEFYKRFPDQKALAEKAYLADQMIAKGLHKQGLSEKATPQEIAAYRKANGIPDKPEAYLADLPEGLVIGDMDKPVIESFTKAALDAEHLPPVKRIQSYIKWYYDQHNEQWGAQTATDQAAFDKMIGTLKKEWGPDYDTNVTITNDWMATLPAELQELLKTARVGDGSPFGGIELKHNIHYTRWITGLARQFTPIGTQTGGDYSGGKDDYTTYLEIRSKMGNRQSEYWKGPKALPMQALYRRLLEKHPEFSKR